MEHISQPDDEQKPIRFEDVNIVNFRLLSCDEAAEMLDVAERTDARIDFDLQELIRQNRHLQALRAKIGRVTHLLEARAAGYGDDAVGETD